MPTRLIQSFVVTQTSGQTTETDSHNYIHIHTVTILNYTLVLNIWQDNNIVQIRV